MKLSIKPKKKPREVDVEEDEAPRKSKMGSKDWMIRGTDRLQKEQRRSDAMAKRNRRPPEMWVKDGDSRIVRFRASEPIGIYQYSLRGAKGWLSVTQPAVGETDLFRKAGMTPQLKYVYEVIDVQGYIDQKGKKVKNVPRFFKANGRMEKQLEKFRQKFGSLTKRNFEICRSGAGKDTQYTIIPDDKSPMTDAMRDAESLIEKFETYYAPPNEDEQRIMLAGILPADDDDD